MRDVPEGFDSWTLVELLGAKRPAWHRHAVCRGRADVSFFVERGEPTAPAKAICKTCPVRIQCAVAGVNEADGVWGGTSARERRSSRPAA